MSNVSFGLPGFFDAMSKCTFSKNVWLTDWQRDRRGTDGLDKCKVSKTKFFFALLSIHPNFVFPQRGRKGRGGKEPFCFFNISSFYGHRRLGGRKRQKIALNIPPPPPLNRKRNILRTYFLCLPHAERRQCLRVWEWPVFKKVFFKKNLVSLPHCIGRIFISWEIQIGEISSWRRFPACEIVTQTFCHSPSSFPPLFCDVSSAATGNFAEKKRGMMKLEQFPLANTEGEFDVCVGRRSYYQQSDMTSFPFPFKIISGHRGVKNAVHATIYFLLYQIWGADRGGGVEALVWRENKLDRGGNGQDVIKLVWLQAIVFPAITSFCTKSWYFLPNWFWERRDFWSPLQLSLAEWRKTEKRHPNFFLKKVPPSLSQTQNDNSDWNKCTGGAESGRHAKKGARGKRRRNVIIIMAWCLTTAANIFFCLVGAGFLGGKISVVASCDFFFFWICDCSLLVFSFFPSLPRFERKEM